MYTFCGLVTDQNETGLDINEHGCSKNIRNLHSKFKQLNQKWKDGNTIWTGYLEKLHVKFYSYLFMKGSNLQKFILQGLEFFLEKKIPTPNPNLTLEG